MKHISEILDKLLSRVEVDEPDDGTPLAPIIPISGRRWHEDRLAEQRQHVDRDPLAG